MSFYEIMPMKMETVERGKIPLSDLLESPDWVLQQKMDGTRAFIKIKYDEISESWDFSWLSSNGSPLKHTAATQHIADVEQALIENHHLHDRLEDPSLTLRKPMEFVVLEAVLDAELIISTGELYIFDMPWLRSSLDGDEKLLVDPATPAMRRLIHIQDVLHVYPEFGRVRSLKTAKGAEEKQRMLGKLSASGVEGGVFKHVHGAYALDPKKRTKAQLKHKFVKDADVVVLERNRGGTQNAVLGVLAPSDASPLGIAMQEIGSCSMIGKPDAQPGDVIEVEYLYWGGGALVQPRMTRIRHDKTPDECSIAQFPAYSREAVQ